MKDYNDRYESWFNEQLTNAAGGSWTWNDTRVDAIVSNIDTKLEVMIKQALDFFTSIDAPNLKKGTIMAMFDAQSYKTSEEAIVEMIKLPEADWVEVIGTNGSKIYEGLRTKLTDIPLYVFAGSTTYFGHGVGVRKWKKLATAANLHKPSDLNGLTVADICAIPGFDEKTAIKIFKGITPFLRFFIKLQDKITFAKAAQIPTGGLMVGHKVCFTGVRSKELEELIVQEGGEIASTVSGKTTILVCADPSSTSGKMGKAKDLGIKCVTLDQMKAMLS